MKYFQKLTEFFNTISTKSNKKFDIRDTVDTKNILPNSEDPEIPILDNNLVYYSIDFNQEFRDIKQLIQTYREIANDHKIEDCIDEIVNESVVADDSNNIISLDLENVDLSDKIKDTIKDEFKYLLNILNFKRRGHELFRQWYIDGRLWFQVLFYKNEKNGIAELKRLSPLDLMRVKNEDGKIYYIYKEDEANKSKRRHQGYSSFENRELDDGYKISEENIVFVPSGLLHPLNNIFISHLHKAIKPLNQLRLLEDSAVIYRITRAPERRVFYIDVGKLPPKKADSYVTSLMNKFKSSVTYDASTGKVTENKNVMTMLEDFYLPTSGDSKGTKVETLQGGSQLGEIEDIRYFKKNLLSSLKVPFSRLDTDEKAMVEIGRPGELTRPELKFQKFSQRLRSDFAILFFELLKTQLVIKNILSIEEWKKIKNNINFIWQNDNYFTELKENEILSQRLDVLSNIDEYIGKFYSSNWVKKNILRQTDDEIKQIEKEIKQNKEDIEDEED